VQNSGDKGAIDRMPDQPFAATLAARLSADQATVRKISDTLAESLDADTVGIAAFEAPDKTWSLALHFRDAPDETAVRALVATAAGAAAADELTFETLAPTDWVRTSLAGLKPVDAGRFVVHGAHDRARIGANRIGIEIEAGLAFGTGNHGTTRGCLLALDWIAKQADSLRHLPLKGGGRPRSGRVGGTLRRARDPHPTPPPFRGRERTESSRQKEKCRKTVLDVGTGTGVLSIAAARALRVPVVASDIDARSVIIARENARLNRAGPLVTIVRANGLGVRTIRAHAPYGIVLANILLEPLRGMATPLARVVARTGRVVLSGLLAAQAVPALVAYRARGLILERRIPLEGWMTLVLRRPAIKRAERRLPQVRA
jgi:ribosomal protein L11 methyltransferase